MTITDAPPQIQPLFNGTQNLAEPTSKPALSSDFETFLKMLTVQMQNQDPLNPVDSADYAVQLATFSSVEQQVLTNDLLTALTASMAGGGIGALGQWVGMEVRAGSTGYLESSPIEMVTPEYDSADRRVLVIRDETANTVARLDIPVRGGDFIWDGKLSDGTTAPQGIYDFSVESYKDGAVQATDPALVYNEVREARIENGITQLVLRGGLLAKPADVTGLRSKD